MKESLPPKKSVLEEFKKLEKEFEEAISEANNYKKKIQLFFPDYGKDDNDKSNDKSG